MILGLANFGQADKVCPFLSLFKVFGHFDGKRGVGGGRVGVLNKQ